MFGQISEHLKVHGTLEVANALNFQERSPTP